MSGPLRLDSLTLCDYRGFRGPGAVKVPLDGKNLLVWGENGVGKTSIFHALSDLFTQHGRPPLHARKNVFSGAPASACHVSARFTDGHEVRWYIDEAGAEHHPTDIGASDDRVVKAAHWRACLDYRALLDTNYRHGDDAVNLFSIARDRLLADFPVSVSGGQTRSIRDLWVAVEAAVPPRPRRHTPPVLRALDSARREFNLGFSDALAALQPHLPTLLTDLNADGATLDPFVFAGVYYDRPARRIAGQELLPRVRFHDHGLERPQHFLNEQRLSAVGLAIYLAGRLASVPRGDDSTLKLLVLDDVLIGLDHANRLPVLDVIERHFSEWQVVLLTYDQVWFDLVRHRTTVSGRWGFVRIAPTPPYGGQPVAPTVIPVQGDRYLDAIVRARESVSHSWSVAGNYARVALEHLLQSACEEKDVRVAYKRDATKIPSSELFEAFKGWLRDPMRRAEPPESLAELLAGVLADVRAVEVFRSWVLNPMSHADPPAITSYEVGRAIDAVEALGRSWRSVKSRLR